MVGPTVSLAGSVRCRPFADTGFEVVIQYVGPVS